MNDLMKLVKYLAILAAGLGALLVSAFLIFTYWEKILSWISAGARVVTNVLKGVTGDNVEKDDPVDYFDEI